MKSRVREEEEEEKIGTDVVIKRDLRIALLDEASAPVIAIERIQEHQGCQDHEDHAQVQ